MPETGDAPVDTATQPARVRKPSPLNADMAWVATRLLGGAELRRHAGVGMAPWWALHARDDKPRRLDDRTVTGLESRGAIAPDDARAEAIRTTVLNLTEAGRALAATLPPVDQAYLTPHERRRGKRVEVWRARDAAWEAKQGVAQD